jgi:hypothetical protein
MGAEIVNREAREGRKEFREFFFAFSLAPSARAGVASLAVKNLLESR